MPIYQFRCEAQDGSGHFRSGRIEADSAEEAKLTLEERERDRAAFQMDEDRIAELLAEHGGSSLDELPYPAPIGSTEEEKAEYRALPVRDRSHLVIHRQDKPYKVKVTEVGGS